MAEVVKECMDRMEKVLPDMPDVLVARLIGYAEGYADRAEQEARNATTNKIGSSEKA